MTRRLSALTVVNVTLLALVVSLCVTFSARAADPYPKPEIFPRSWELKFQHTTPKRIVVEEPGKNAPTAFWYMTYTVTNLSDQEQMFLPVFELMDRHGNVQRADSDIPGNVFDRIRDRERIPFLEPYLRIAGPIRIGEDQARDGVAIWREPDARMGKFTIFVAGLSGETANLPDDAGKPLMGADGKPILLRKTFALHFHVRGDEVFPGEDEVNPKASEWIMR